MEGVHHVKMRQPIRTGQCADGSIATVEGSCGLSVFCFFFVIDTCMSKIYIQLLDANSHSGLGINDSTVDLTQCVFRSSLPLNITLIFDTEINGVNFCMH